MKKVLTSVGANAVAKSGAIVFVGTMVMNVAAYVYHLLMGRLLGPVGYGELSSLFSLLYIINVPLLVGQTVLVKFVSEYKACDEPGQTKSLFLTVTKYFALGSLIGLPVAIIVSPGIAGFLHLTSSLSVILVYIMVVFSLLSIASSSVLQGYQMFIWSSVLSAGALVFRVIISVPMAAEGVQGVMWASVIASVLVYLIYFYPLKFLLSIKNVPIVMKITDALTFVIPTFICLLGITSIYSTDIILVRHYFSAADAGLYAALAVLGKIIFYASSAVITVVFPIIAERKAKGKEIKSIVLSAIGIVSAISLGLCVSFSLFPTFIIQSLFGNAYSQAYTLLGLFGIFLGLFSVGNSLVMVSLASGHTKIWIVCVLCAIVQLLTIVFFHTNISTVIWINIAISAGLVIASAIYVHGFIYEKI